MTELSESRNEFYKKLIHSFQNDADPQIYDKIYSNLCGLLAHGDLNNKEYDLLKEVLYELAYIIHSGFISGYQNRYGDNLKPPTNVYHRMTA